MDSAVAVHTNGVGLALLCSTKRSIFATSALTLENDPRRIAFWVMMPNQRSTWLS
jgi:hypothetical protein